ncbi:hypothetical protein BH23CHL7_BH23CHL7_14580 [soil metagenome]
MVTRLVSSPLSWRELLVVASQLTIVGSLLFVIAVMRRFGLKAPETVLFSANIAAGMIGLAYGRRPRQQG